MLGLPLLFSCGLSTQASGEWEGGEARIWGSLLDGVLKAVWSQETSQRRSVKPAADGRYYWGRVVLRFTGDTFSGEWAYCGAPSAGRFDGAAAGARIPARRTAPPQQPLVLLTSDRTVDFDDYHLKAGRGWALPEAPNKGKWVLTYGAPLRNGPASPVTPLHIDLYATSRSYANEAEWQQAVEDLRAAIWYGKAPIASTDTMKVGGSQADR